jgi:hypothetical protein
LENIAAADNTMTVAKRLQTQPNTRLKFTRLLLAVAAFGIEAFATEASGMEAFAAGSTGAAAVGMDREGEGESVMEVI